MKNGISKEIRCYIENNIQEFLIHSCIVDFFVNKYSNIKRRNINSSLNTLYKSKWFRNSNLKCYKSNKGHNNLIIINEQISLLKKEAIIKKFSLEEKKDNEYNSKFKKQSREKNYKITQKFKISVNIICTLPGKDCYDIFYFSRKYNKNIIYYCIEKDSKNYKEIYKTLSNDTRYLLFKEDVFDFLRRMKKIEFDILNLDLMCEFSEKIENEFINLNKSKKCKVISINLQANLRFKQIWFLIKFKNKTLKEVLIKIFKNYVLVDDFKYKNSNKAQSMHTFYFVRNDII